MLAFTVDKQLAKQVIVLRCPDGREIKIHTQRKPNNRTNKFSLGIEAPKDIKIFRVMDNKLLP